MSQSSDGPRPRPVQLHRQWDDSPAYALSLGGNAPKEPPPAIPWHPDIAEFAQRIVRRVIRDVDRLPVGSGTLLTEPVLVALRRPGKNASYDVTDARGRMVGEATHRRPRLRGNDDYGAKAVTISSTDGVVITSKMSRDSVWSVRGTGRSVYTIEPGIPEAMRGMALEAMNYFAGTKLLAERIVLTEDLAIATRRFFAPITDSIEVEGRAVAVIEDGVSAPVRSRQYPGLEEGAPWRVLCRLRPVDAPTTELILADWLSPAHGP